MPRRRPFDNTRHTLESLPKLALTLPRRALHLGASVPKRRIGAPPGTLPDSSLEAGQEARIRAIRYGPDQQAAIQDVTPDKLVNLRSGPGMLWVDMVGVADLEALKEVAQVFSLHPLMVEDIAHPHQRPKSESYEVDDGAEQLFIVARLLHTPDTEASEVRAEQIGIVVGNNFVLTFQEFEGDVFDPIRERIRHNGGRIRRLGPDYLAYLLLDIIIDHYFVVMEALGDGIDALETDIINGPDRHHQDQIRAYRRTVIYLRRSIWPLREAIAGLLRDESPLITPSTRVFLRDAYDHTVQVVEIMETFRDVLSTLNDLYLSSLSHRLNEVMKVLTIVGTVFIPLSFLAGIYGMNFHYMPELGYRYSYPIFLGVVILILVASWLLFKRRGWI